MNINDKLLQSALLDAAAEEFDDILSGNDPPVRFSDDYCKRRSRFLKAPLKRTHNTLSVFKHCASCAAVFVVVLLILFGSSRLSLDASAQCRQGMTKPYKAHLTYSYKGDFSDNICINEYTITHIPAGYTEYTRESASDYCRIVYVNGTKLLNFMYFHTLAYMNIKMDTGDYHLIPTEVNEKPAIFHEAELDGMSNILMWFSDDNSTVFILDAALSRDELITIAESTSLQ